MFVRHEMYRDQTAGPRSANFGKHMHLDKVSSPINLQVVKVLDLHFQVKKSTGVHSKIHSWFCRKMLTVREEIVIYYTLSQI